MEETGEDSKSAAEGEERSHPIHAPDVSFLSVGEDLVFSLVTGKGVTGRKTGSEISFLDAGVLAGDPRWGYRKGGGHQG